MLEKAKQNLKTDFALAGITERMEETLCLLHRTFQWHSIVAGYPKNVTLKRTDRNSVSLELQNLIAKRNDLDMKLYEFVQDQLNQKIEAEGQSFRIALNEYRQKLKDLVLQSASRSDEQQKIHQFVLEMMATGESR